MFAAEHFRTKLAESAESIKNTDAPSEIRKLQQSMKSFGLLAENEDWLAESFEVPSGMWLEFGDAISGNMKVSFQAARSIG